MLKKYRSRKHGLLLYPENDSHVLALEELKKYDYAMILHDRDCDEDGVVLKPHWHVVLSLKNAQWNSALAESLGITPNFIQQIRSEEASLEYLIHHNEPAKYQYAIDDVKGSLKRKLIDYIAKDEKSESEKVCELIQYISEYNGKLSTSQLARHCAQIGYWDVFRRSATIFLKILYEKEIT